MAIFRCTWCNEVFDISMQYEIEGLVFCGKCHSIYKDILKPKVYKPMTESPFEKDDHIHIPKKKGK